LKMMSPQLPEASKEEATASPSYLTRPQAHSTRLGWWYALASPSAPPGDATFEAQERFRQGRTGGQIILALYALLAATLLTTFVGTNGNLLLIVGCAGGSLVVATILNRLGRVTPSGILVVLTFAAFPVANIVTTPGGLSLVAFPLFGLLFLPLLCAVSFLAPWWVFVVALGNSLFTLYALTMLPRTVEVDALLAVNFSGVVTPILMSQMMVSTVAYLWVAGTKEALLRADRAEQIARLEHDLAKQSEEAARQKQQLEESIQHIVQTHQRVANGDFEARVPVGENNVLWQISGSLNTLLARCGRWRQDAAELVRVQHKLNLANEEIVRLTRLLGSKP
jgi:hypothetical protein